MHPCNLIEIAGGHKKQRDRVLDVMVFCIDEMMPRHRSLDIMVHLGNYEKTQAVLGQCLHVGGNEFQIDLDSKQDLYNLILTTCHEMVHVNQYSRKQLKEDFPRTLWFGKSYTDQRCLPWELDAWKQQKPLCHKYIKEHTNYTIKDIKVLDKRC